MTSKATLHASMDAMILALTQSANAHEDRFSDLDKGRWLYDFRTVGFYLPRQQGSLDWMLARLLENPHATLISKYKKMMLEKIDQVTQSSVVRPEIYKDYLERVKARVFEPYDLSKWISQRKPCETTTTELIIDNSSVVFNNIRINHFYDWLEASPGISRETVVIRIN